MSQFLPRIGRGLVWVLSASTKLATAKQKFALAAFGSALVFIALWPIPGSLALISILFAIGYLTESKDHDDPDNR